MTACNCVGRFCHHVSWMASRFIPTMRESVSSGHEVPRSALCQGRPRLMVGTILAYAGALVALGLLWFASGRRPFTVHRWFVILPIAIAGAAAGAVIPAHQAAAALARTVGEPIDYASLPGAVLRPQSTARTRPDRNDSHEGIRAPDPGGSDPNGLIAPSLVMPAIEGVLAVAIRRPSRHRPAPSGHLLPSRLPSPPPPPATTPSPSRLPLPHPRPTLSLSPTGRLNVLSVR